VNLYTCYIESGITRASTIFLFPKRGPTFSTLHLFASMRWWFSRLVSSLVCEEWCHPLGGAAGHWNNGVVTRHHRPRWEALGVADWFQWWSIDLRLQSAAAWSRESSRFYTQFTIFTYYLFSKFVSRLCNREIDINTSSFPKLLLGSREICELMSRQSTWQVALLSPNTLPCIIK